MDTYDAKKLEHRKVLVPLQVIFNFWVGYRLRDGRKPTLCVDKSTTEESLDAITEHIDISFYMCSIRLLSFGFSTRRVPYKTGGSTYLCNTFGINASDD